MRIHPVILLLIIASFLFASTPLDTLRILESFDSPVPNPRAIVYDCPDFWISNQQNALLYKIDPQMRIIDSILLPFAKITGMTFKEDELWVVRDSSISGLYQIDLETGTIQDSIIIRSNATKASSSYLWGLVYYRSRFFISYNGGWGPCIKAIDLITGNSSNCCCPHPAGMKIIGDEWWSVRQRTEDNGRCLAMLSTTDWDSAAINSVAEKYRYTFSFDACDLAFDGSNIWLVDQVNSKICKMAGFSTAVTSRKSEIKQGYSGRILKFEQGLLRIDVTLLPEIPTVELLNIQGQSIDKIPIKNRSSIYNCSRLPAGVYFARFKLCGKMQIERFLVQQ